MEIKESIRAGLKELILPEIDKIREENSEIKAILSLTNKRLDDINVHLADQSRRIDAAREELSQRIDETNKRIDETNKRIDETNKRIDSVREEVGEEIRETNKRLDRLYEVIVRRDEQTQVVQRLTTLEKDVAEMKRRIAA